MFPLVQRLAVTENTDLFMRNRRKKIQEEGKENMSLGGGDRKSDLAKNRVSPFGETLIKKQTQMSIELLKISLCKIEQ